LQENTSYAHIWSINFISKAKIDACVSIYLRLSKASCYFFPYLNVTSFLTISFIGDVMGLKSLTNLVTPLMYD